MPTIAYLDCFAGISGDMTLAALVDLGVPIHWLKDQLQRVVPEPFELTVTTVHRNGIRATDLQVNCAAAGHHRHWSDIRKQIYASSMPEKTVRLAEAIFQRLAHAEASVHGCSVEEVHFHEVGAVDAMVDIIGTALAAEYLKIEQVVAAPIPVGGGLVTCEHGILPVPAPATLKLLEGVPIVGSEEQQEMVTPTGAAIATAWAADFGPMPDMVVSKNGYGAGKRRFQTRPNLLRIVLGETRAQAADLETVMLVETAIDDMVPELFGHVMEKLFELGALDVCLIPVFMKKNRPATLMQALCTPDLADAVSECMLRETSSLGVRRYPAQRRVLPREAVKVPTAFGEILAKSVWSPDGHRRLVPEYDACRQLAREKDLPLREIYEAVLKADPKAASKVDDS